MSTSTTGLTSIRLRAILLGLFLAIGICLLTPINNIYNQGTPLGGGHFPLAPFVIFFFLALISFFINRIFSTIVILNGLELLVIWIKMVIGSGIAYTGLARTFLLNLTAPIHFASKGNMWQESLKPFLPSSLVPTNNNAVSQLYEGIPGGRNMDWMDVLLHIPWSSWLTPLCVWSLFIVLCYCTMLFLVNIISRQWIHNERLNFPLLKVPEIISKAVDDRNLGSLLTDKFLIIGLSLPICLHLLNGASFYYPSIPQLPTLILAGPYFSDHGIFAGFHKIKIYLYPAFIGFAFLASRQISFSFWFFYLSGCLLYGILTVLGYIIPTSELGITFGPTLSRPEEMQMIGAYGVFFLFLVWLARQHLLDITKQSFFLKKATSANTEWFDVRISFWGFMVCYGAIIFWYTSLGMSLTTSFLVVGAFFMIMIVATRIICQGGLAYFTLTAAPLDGIIALLGTKIFAGTNGLLAGMSQKVLFVDLRESLMPSLVHGRKIHHTNRPALLLFSSLALTILFSMLASLVAMMALCYRYGIRELELEWATRTTLTVYENVNRLIIYPPSTGGWVYTFALTGALVMLLLVVAYHRFFWWPIHPIGYLTAYSSAMRILWVSFFIGWACNALCIRYGGVVLFRKIQFFFVGLIIGDLLMGGGWAFVGLFTDTAYQVLPN